MDSSAYLHLIEELQTACGAQSRHLPIDFLRAPTVDPAQSRKLVVAFLDALAAACAPRSISSEWACPAVLTSGTEGTLAARIAYAHRDIAQYLQVSQTAGAAHESSALRDHAELLAFVSRAAHPHRAVLFGKRDALSYAMSVFLIEAFMHAGWCPNTFETQAKRAAHLFFSHARASLVFADQSALSTILCYLWGAWSLAQKTEGIREHFLETERGGTHFHYSLTSGQSPCHYDAYHFSHSPFLFAIRRDYAYFAHPFSILCNETVVGLTLYVGDKPVTPVEIEDFSPIERPHHIGQRQTYQCVTAQGDAIRWTIMIQVFGETIFRVDALRACNAPVNISKAQLRIENDIPLSPAEPDWWNGRQAGDGIVVQWQRNPLSFTYAGQEPGGISLFAGGACTIGCDDPMEMCVGWKREKGVTAIDKTNLLGIPDV